jgi:hypothetical protein
VVQWWAARAAAQRAYPVRSGALQGSRRHRHQLQSQGPMRAHGGGKSKRVPDPDFGIQYDELVAASYVSRAEPAADTGVVCLWSVSVPTRPEIVLECPVRGGGCFRLVSLFTYTRSRRVR